MYKSDYIVITARNTIRFRVRIEHAHPAAEFVRLYSKWVEYGDEVFVRLGGQWVANAKFQLKELQNDNSSTH
jgi:hypothetical protein